ncbi:MAG: sterol desaturase family protein [Rhodovibrionaceae bacterium]|nr:sterol desaturase family protein [Rhodovibrionaceae bacterium]
MAFVIEHWKGRAHDLGRMSLKDLVKNYFTYPAIVAYLALGVVAAGFAVYTAKAFWPVALAALAAVLIYPLIWYLLHRYVLHGRYLYKNRFTAGVWKRIHFDHHQDPHDLRVLFGALYTTLPTIVAVTLPLGYLIGGSAAAGAALASGLFTTCVYEFCHCVQHLNFQPKSKFLQRIKRLHLAHHFHNEAGNYGITNFLWDRVLSTYYASPKEVAKSPTVFNLGYTADEAERYPWVLELSGGERRDDGPKSIRPSRRANSGADGLGGAGASPSGA